MAFMSIHSSYSFTPPLEVSANTTPDTREKLLNHNWVYRLLCKNRHRVLTKRALRGLNDDSGRDAHGLIQQPSGPATLAQSESTELLGFWCHFQTRKALDEGKLVDEWTVTVQDYQRWADDVVQCFPGESKTTWYTPKQSLSSVSIIG